MYNVLLSDDSRLALRITRKCRLYGHAHRVLPLTDYDTAYPLNSGYKKIGVIISSTASNNYMRALAKSVYIGRRYPGRTMFINGLDNSNTTDTFSVIKETFKPCPKILFFKSADAYINFMQEQAVHVPEDKCLLPPYKPLLDKAVCTVCRRATCPKVIRRKGGL